MQNAPKGISSVQQKKELGISLRSAWFMLDRLLEAMDLGDEKLKDEVEIDGTYFGDLEKNIHSKKRLRVRERTGGKQAVLSMRERGGRFVLLPVHDIQEYTLEDYILFQGEKGSTTFIDELMSFGGLGDWYEHGVFKLSNGEYVSEEVTIYIIESVWAIVKRSHSGVYHERSRKDGHRYYDEIAFRLVEGNVGLPIMIIIKHHARKSIETRFAYKELVNWKRRFETMRVRKKRALAPACNLQALFRPRDCGGGLPA